MNARDELAGLLFTTDNSKSVSPWSEWERCKDDPRLAGYVYALADAILAAGYRRPRTITTAEELDALPVGSVVLRNGRAFQRYGPTPAPFDEYKMWRCGDGGFVRSTKDGVTILPATVLYEPEQP